MRQGQNRRMRGRNRGGRGPNPLQRSYESNGPDVKVRGTAQHIAEKYVQLARDAQASGDPVMAESYFQHAEHYWRIVLAAQEQMAQQYGTQFQPQRPFGEEGDDGDEEGDDEGGAYPMGADQPGGPGQQGMNQQGGQGDDGQPWQGERGREQQGGGWRGDNNRNGQRFDRQDRNNDRNNNDRNNRRFDRNDRNNQDRNNQDRGGQDRGGQERGNADRNMQGRHDGDRPQGERQQGERFGRDRNDRPRRDFTPREDQGSEQPRLDPAESPQPMQAEVQGRQPRAVIDADEAPAGLPSFVTAPRRRVIDVESTDAPEAAPSSAEGSDAAPRRRGRPPGSRNKAKAEAEGAAE